MARRAVKLKIQRREHAQEDMLLAPLPNVADNVESIDIEGRPE